MTIALGILAPDGVVIAADTQESWGYFGGAKISGKKILSRIVDGQDRSFAATGAGQAGYLDSLNQELDDNFVDVSDFSKLERRFREKVGKFFHHHVVPMQLPSESHPSIIVGVTWRGESPRLWANDQSALFRCKHFMATGAGRAHASMLLNRLLPNKTETTCEYAAAVAAFVIYQVKDYVEGCGMGTHVTILKDGNAKYVDSAAVQRLERKFERVITRSDASWAKAGHWDREITDSLVQVKGEAVTKPSAVRRSEAV